MNEQTIYLDRNGDQWVTSYDVWAKAGSYPQFVGDGTFVDNVEMGPDEEYKNYTWTPPTAGTWYYAAVSIYRRSPGIFYQLNGT